MACGFTRQGLNFTGNFSGKNIYEYLSVEVVITQKVALAEKTSQWVMKAKRSFNIFPCPETPFNAKYDAFRDWVQFSISWKDYKGELLCHQWF